MHEGIVCLLRLKYKKTNLRQPGQVSFSMFHVSKCRGCKINSPVILYTYKVNLTWLTFKLFAHRMRNNVRPPFVLQTVTDVINVYVFDCFVVSEGFPSMLSVFLFSFFIKST